MNPNNKKNEEIGESLASIARSNEILSKSNESLSLATRNMSEALNLEERRRNAV